LGLVVGVEERRIFRSCPTTFRRVNQRQDGRADMLRQSCPCQDNLCQRFPSVSNWLCVFYCVLAFSDFQNLLTFIRFSI
jgi:hypothetical protein